VSRFVVDASAVLELLERDILPSPQHRLVAPTLLRSQVLARLHESVARGEISNDEGRDRHRRFGRLPIRLLGDAVLRRRAWEIADRLDWVETYDAEYLAATQLQADAFVTADPDLARAAAAVVEVAPLDALR
jgi:predicted nucleic acid-binding protein